MAQTGIAEAYLASGWCVRCGYKRSAQGNCPNCDHWYTHPLLTIGGPLTLSLLILLLVGIRSLRESDTGFARFHNGLLHAAPMPAFIDPNPPRATRTAPPVFFKPANPGAVPVIRDEASRLEKQYANLESLRETVHTAERGYVTGEMPPTRVQPTLSMPSRVGRARAEQAQLTL